jgi:predicted enzyme related to lactoylglutathione lyase
MMKRRKGSNVVSQLTGTGVFFWRDLYTNDQKKALDFYSKLFGWRLNAEYPVSDDESYYVIETNGQRFGGITRLPADAPSHPYWNSYIRTPDVDATAERATAKGGSVLMPPTDIPNVGRFSVIADPAGAAFAAMTDNMPEPVPYDDDVADGGVTWNELLTTDVDGSLAFYADLFGYGIDKQEMGPGMAYSMLTIEQGGQQVHVAGVFPRPEQMRVSAWMIYFKVANIEAARQKIEELGGKNVGPVLEVPGTGRMSTAVDSTGGYFSIHEYA